MAEQFLRAWSMNQNDLYSIVGKKDDVLLKKVKENKALTEEIDELIQEWGDYSFEKSLRDIVNGELKSARSYEYLRTLEVILELNGKPLVDEITMPGRGWQNIGLLFLDWKLPLMQKLWSDKHLAFPWKLEDKATVPNWPVYMVLEKNKIHQLKNELENFDPKLLEKFPLSERQEGLDEEIELFIETLLTWFKNADKDLILLLDGQQ